jgi:hypothetical protein
MGEFFERIHEALMRLELCAAGHTFADVRGEGCHAKTLLAVNEEFEFLRG